MPGLFGSSGDVGRDSRRPFDRVVEGNPTLDVFALRRDGLLAEGAVTDLEFGPASCWRLTRTLGKITLGDQNIRIHTHAALPVEVFVCGCGRDCYRLYCVDGRWRCRVCGKLSYASRHRDRSVPGLARLRWLRARIGASPVPFSPIAPRPLQARRYWRLAREIRDIEARLAQHLRVDVNDVIERRLDDPRRRRRRS